MGVHAGFSVKMAMALFLLCVSCSLKGEILCVSVMCIKRHFTCTSFTHLCRNAIVFFKHIFVCACVCSCVQLIWNTLPNIITAYQGHFPLSGLAVPAGVDWEKIRAYSVDYKKSCKQSHVLATGRKQRAASMQETHSCIGWRTGRLAQRSTILTIWLVRLLGSCLAVWLSTVPSTPLASTARH